MNIILAGYNVEKETLEKLAAADARIRLINHPCNFGPGSGGFTGIKAAEGEDKAALRRAWYTALARGDATRARRYLAWLDHPPDPPAPGPPAGGQKQSR